MKGEYPLHFTPSYFSSSFYLSVCHLSFLSVSSSLSLSIRFPFPLYILISLSVCFVHAFKLYTCMSIYYLSIYSFPSPARVHIYCSHISPLFTQTLLLSFYPSSSNRSFLSLILLVALRPCPRCIFLLDSMLFVILDPFKVVVLIFLY